MKIYESDKYNVISCKYYQTDIRITSLIAKSLQ